MAMKFSMFRKPRGAVLVCWSKPFIAASLARQTAQGSTGLAQAAGALARQAIGNVLPGSAQGVLAKASQFGAAAKQIGTLAQSARAVASMPKTL